MTATFNIPEESTLAQRNRSGLLTLRAAMDAVFSVRPSRPKHFDDDANQIERGRLAHHRREGIRRATDELRRPGVRN